MNNIVLIIGLLLAFVTGFFSAIKSVHLGLKWNIQVEKKEEPKLEPFKGMTEVVNGFNNDKSIKQAEISNQNQQRIINEWFFGKEGE